MTDAACWADGPDEYIVPAPGGGFDTTRECAALAGSCTLGLCDEHCSTTHKEEA